MKVQPAQHNPTALALLCAATLLGCTPEVSVGDDRDEPAPITEPAEPSPTVPRTGEPTEAAPFQDTAVAYDRLLAGAWSDLHDWELWLDLLALDQPWHASQTSWGFDTSQRAAVSVRAGAEPVADAEVRLAYRGQLAWTARTDARGEVDLFPGLFEPGGGPWDLTAIASGRAAQTFNVQAGSSPPRTITLHDEALPTPTAVDLHWTLDHRHASARQTRWLHEALPALLSELDEALAGPLQPRYGLSLPGATHPLDPALDPLLDLLATEPTPGPARTLTALLTEAAALDWSASARARVCFLVLGAVDLSEEQLPALHAATTELARRGVRVVAIGTSADLSTSFLLRQLAIATQGRWWFVLDDGPSEPTALVGDYTTDDLHAHMRDYIAEAAALP